MIGRVLVAVLLLATASGAAAQVSDDEWWAAESDHFRVLSSGSGEDARSMAIKLERLDQALRLFRGLPATSGTDIQSSKPTVFQYGRASDIGGLIGAQSVLGFFIPRAGDSVAYVPLVADNRIDRSGSLGARQSFEFDTGSIPPTEVLFHEYVHYFMFQHAPAAYPSWYIEGFAELFGMIGLTDTGFTLGEAPEARKTELRIIPVDQRDLFDPPKDQRSVTVDYAHGWLATSYLSFEPTRRGQLTKYLNLINTGKPSKEAAAEAFGDLGKLEDELNRYRRQRAQGIAVNFPQRAEPNVVLRRLTAAENAAMPVVLKLKAGITKAEARSLAGRMQALRKTYPDNLTVVLTAAGTELDAGNLEQADALAQQALKIDPRSVEALLYRARIAMEYAQKEPSYLTQARAHYVAANRIDNDQPEALAGYYRTFVLAGTTPPEDALIALETAYRHAPFDRDIRKTLAHLLLTEKRDASAMAVLGPVINSPHARKPDRELRALAMDPSAESRAALIEKLKPVLKKDN